MQRVAIVLVSLVFAGAVMPPLEAGQLTIAHCLQGCPTGTSSANEILVRHLYAVSINPGTRLADWVSYRILPGSIGVASLLPRDWQSDDLARNGIRVEQLRGEGDQLVQQASGDQQDSVYRITEFSVAAGDQGRLVPMTSFAGTSYWSDLNLLSIMSLMKSDLRLESWSRLDQAVNSLVRSDGELFVVAGPIYQSAGTGQPGTVGAVPDAYFKVVANASGQLAAFIFDQDLPAHASHCDQLTGLDAVESASGLDLFPTADAWPTGSLASRLGC
ncbi:MAG: DNA/RNA non-specific endonuclease [Gammaproteobacteria bacterium]|nr:DNA/RNA non-specific endonuclease [Pseudomonadales bacterium]MCP5346771.1 DNA/RNA non-specific endonuclease [Pseudomonadales bacterium]